MFVVARNQIREPNIRQMAVRVPTCKCLSGRVTTGTPIQSDSQVVIPPEYGCVSRAMSTA